MSTEQRSAVQRAIREAYATNCLQWAYYLELCLKTNEAPR